MHKHTCTGEISGSGAVVLRLGKLNFDIILQCFVIFKNVVHTSLKPGETPIDSASL